MGVMIQCIFLISQLERVLGIINIFEEIIKGIGNYFQIIIAIVLIRCFIFSRINHFDNMILSVVGFGCFVAQGVFGSVFPTFFIVVICYCFPIRVFFLVAITGEIKVISNCAAALTGSRSVFSPGLGYHIR